MTDYEVKCEGSSVEVRPSIENFHIVLLGMRLKADPNHKNMIEIKTERPNKTFLEDSDIMTTTLALDPEVEPAATERVADHMSFVLTACHFEVARI